MAGPTSFGLVRLHSCTDTDASIGGLEHNTGDSILHDRLQLVCECACES